MPLLLLSQAMRRAPLLAKEGAGVTSVEVDAEDVEDAEGVGCRAHAVYTQWPVWNGTYCCAGTLHGDTTRRCSPLLVRGREVSREACRSSLRLAILMTATRALRARTARKKASRSGKNRGFHKKGLP